MSQSASTLRAYRPSAYRDEDDLADRLVQAVKARNVARYARMVSRGLHLFESAGVDEWQDDMEASDSSRR